MATLGEVVRGLFSQKPEPPPPAAPAGLFAETPETPEQVAKRKADKQLEELNYYKVFIAREELDADKRGLYTKGTDYTPYIVPVNGKPEGFYTIGEGLKLDKSGIARINEIAKKTIIDKKSINLASRVPQHIVDQITLEKWNSAVKEADRILGADNQAKYIYASMVYQMGKDGAETFKKAIKYLKMGTPEGFREAANEIARSGKDPSIKSPLMQQTPKRVERMQSMLRDLANYKEQSK